MIVRVSVVLNRTVLDSVCRFETFAVVIFRINKNGISTNPSVEVLEPTRNVSKLE